LTPEKREHSILRVDSGGGGIEIEIKEDKQGLGTSKRNKKRFPAQQILCQLEVLAHNLLVLGEI